MTGSTAYSVCVSVGKKIKCENQNDDPEANEQMNILLMIFFFSYLCCCLSVSSSYSSLKSSSSFLFSAHTTPVTPGAYLLPVSRSPATTFFQSKGNYPALTHRQAITPQVAR
jgi:hypothetical protein